MTLSEGISPSLEIPTMVSANTAHAVMGIVESITTSECSFRSMNVFHTNDAVSFEFTVHGAPKAVVRGRIVSSAQRGLRYFYAVAIAPMVLHERDALVAAIEAARNHSVPKLAPDHPTGTGLTRESLRVPANFDVAYETAGGLAGTARATNISAGGILLNCEASLEVGSALELRFGLPSPDLGRPARQLQCRARIVARQRGTPHYNLAFYKLDGASHLAIERFVRENAG